MVSVVIPTLNEARGIEKMLCAVEAMHGAAEVIVVDGGSTDETIAIAAQHPLRVIAAERGRGAQMHAGACAARGDAIWFLHADTMPPGDGVLKIVEALADPAVVGGNFAVHWDGDSSAARRLSWLYPHLRKIGLCYGDSGLFVRRADYFSAGGFQPFPIFEDLDLVNRLKRRGRFVSLQCQLITSSRRFEGRSFSLTFARWSMLQVLYWMGVSPQRLGRFYAPIRKAG